VLAFIVSLCTDMLTVGQGVIAWVALWVVAYTIRVYYGHWERYDA